jgi:hypothetical protein
MSEIFDYWIQGGWPMIVIFVLGVWGYYLAFISESKTSNIIINATPLVGLLGTVIGMIRTFSAISSNGNSIEGMSQGISQALITTQMGLCIAIVGSIIMVLKRKPQ